MVIGNRFLLASLFVLAANALAAAPTIEEIKSARARLKAPQKLSAEFTQTSFRKVRNRKISRKGRAFFAKPDRVRWIYETNGSEELVFDGQKIERYFPDEKQVNRCDRVSGAAQEISNIVSMILDLSQLDLQYQTTSLKKDAKTGSFVVEMKPKAKNSDIDRLEISMAGSGYVDQVNIQYHDGNATEIAFSSHSEVFEEKELGLRLPNGVRETNICGP